MNQSSNPLFDLSACNARNQFNNLPMEFIVPEPTQVVFVSDLFSTDYEGGAELTSEALLTSNTSPDKHFRVHSPSLTVDMLVKNKDKTWIIANFTQCDISVLMFLPTSGIKYYIVEYDYKYCVYRSEVMHRLQEKSECGCYKGKHGKIIELLHSNAQKVFWMSEAQKNHFHSRLPSLKEESNEQAPRNVVLGSVFKDEDLDFLVEVAAKEKLVKKPIEIWAIQNSPNWIKGSNETTAWCKSQDKIYRLLGGMPYKEFTKALSTCYGLAFRPLDKDTCPRIVIEAKIMGLELALNDNVQHKDEAWFSKTPEEIVAHLKTRAEFFWSQIEYMRR